MRKALIVIVALLLTGCSSSPKYEQATETDGKREFSQSEQTTDEIVDVKEFTIDTDINSEYLLTEYDEKSAKRIELLETVTITEAGTYIISGKLDDGQIIVNSKDNEKVRLVFDGVDISSSVGSAIEIVDGKIIITLADGSNNILSDATTYKEDTKASACIYSDKDLCINGNGSLEIKANYDAGIQSKKELFITGGNIKITSVGDGIKGKDCVFIKDGDINVNAEKDGIQSTNILDNTGYVIVMGGNIEISSKSDGIKGETIVEVDGGDINSTESEEGIEALYVRINGGNVKMNVSDDGINATNGSGQDVGGMFAGRGASQRAVTNIPTIYVNGGNTHVIAGGDGIDSNGAIYVTGGILNVDAPDNGGNGFFDYATAFKVTDGEIVATGVQGMMELPDNTSTQNMIVAGGFNGVVGTEIKLVDISGNTILSYTPEKNFSAVAFTCADIKTDETYTVYCGDTKVGSVEVSDIVNYIGISGGMSGGMRPGRGNWGGQRPNGNMPNGERPEMPSGEIPKETIDIY